MFFYDSANTPIEDDYQFILPFATKVAEGGLTFSDWFGQYYSHRHILARGLIWLDVIATGRIDLQHLQFLAFGLYIAIWLLFISQVTLRGPKPAAYLAVALVIFQPQGLSNVTTAMEAIVWVPMIVIALLTARSLLSQSSLLFGLGLVLGTLAVFTQANGLVLLPAAVPFALVRREWTRAAIIVVLSGINAFVFFYHFKMPDEQLHGTFTELLLNMLAMVGGIFQFGSMPFWIAELAAAVLIVACSGLILVSLAKPDWHGFAVFLSFVLLSIAMTAVGRLGWGSAYLAIQDRYRIYGLLLLMAVVLCGYVFAFPRWPRIVLFASAVLFSLMFGYAQNLPKIVNLNHYLRVQMANLQLGQYLVAPDETTEANLRKAVASGVYLPPQILDPKEVAVLKSGPGVSGLPAIALLASASSAVHGYIVSPADGPENAAFNSAFMVSLTKGEDTLLMPLERYRNRHIDTLTTGKLFSNRAYGVLPERAQFVLDDASYDVRGWREAPSGIQEVFVAKGIMRE